MKSAKPKRRWLKLSLRTFLVLLTVGCIWLGWTVNRARQQRAAKEWVTGLGGKVYYDVEFRDNGRPKVGAGTPPGPAWLRRLVGIDYVATIKGVDIFFDSSAGALPSDPLDLTPFASLADLRFLNLSASVERSRRLLEVKDLSPLSNLKKLRYLHLTNTNVNDIEPLSDLTQLVYLDLDYTRVSDLSPIKNLKKLGHLDLSGNPQIKVIEPLAELTNLRMLDLNSTGVSDVTALSDLPNLSFLELDDTPVSDISPLSDLRNLGNLNLGNTSVTDISPLRNMTQLSALNLGDTKVSDIEPLRNLTQLKYLRLNRTKVVDIEPLNNLKRLMNLDLESTMVSDIGPLRNLDQLKDLDLKHTRVSDVEPLSNLTRLETLDLRRDRFVAGPVTIEADEIPSIKDVEPLTYLTGLKYLNVEGTGITEADFNVLQQALKYTKLVGWFERTRPMRRRTPPQDAEFTRASVPTTSGSVTMIYDPNTGDVTLNAGAGVSIKALQLTSAGSLLLPGSATKQATEGPFDRVTKSKALKLDRDGSFTELEYGPILPKGLDFETIRLDMKIRGSLFVRGSPMSVRDTTPLLFVVPHEN